MSVNDSMQMLRASDPARDLEPLGLQARQVLRDQITAIGWAPRSLSHASRRTRPLQVFAAAAALVVGVGAAWASGIITPLTLFQSNPQQSGHDATPGGLWDQQVVPASVVEAAQIDLPAVGTVGFWYGYTQQGGWCSALRLPSGEWVGTGKDPLDAGGNVPGCLPTREAVNGGSKTPVYVINGFDYVEGMVDARAAGGSFWRIEYGKITIPGAARIEDTVSGRSAPVVQHDLFTLAIPDAHPQSATDLHLVAYDAYGKIIGSTS